MSELTEAVDRLVSVYDGSPDTMGYMADRYPGLHHAIENVMVARTRTRDAEDIPVALLPDLVAAVEQARGAAKEQWHTGQDKAATYGAIVALELLARALTHPERDGAATPPDPGPATPAPTGGSGAAESATGDPTTPDAAPSRPALLELVDALTSIETCAYDHNRDCQTHGYFGLGDANCPHHDAQDLLRSWGLR